MENMTIGQCGNGLHQPLEISAEAVRLTGKNIEKRQGVWYTGNRRSIASSFWLDDILKRQEWDTPNNRLQEG